MIASNACRKLSRTVGLDTTDLLFVSAEPHSIRGFPSKGPTSKPRGIWSCYHSFGKQSLHHASRSIAPIATLSSRGEITTHKSKYARTFHSGSICEGRWSAHRRSSCRQGNSHGRRPAALSSFSL